MKKLLLGLLIVGTMTSCVNAKSAVTVNIKNLELTEGRYELEVIKTGEDDDEKLVIDIKKTN